MYSFQKRYLEFIILLYCCHRYIFFSHCHIEKRKSYQHFLTISVPSLYFSCQSIWSNLYPHKLEENLSMADLLLIFAWNLFLYLTFLLWSHFSWAFLSKIKILFRLNEYKFGKIMLLCTTQEAKNDESQPSYIEDISFTLNDETKI